MAQASARAKKQPLTFSRALTKAKRCVPRKDSLSQLLQGAAGKATRHYEFLQDPWDCLQMLFRLIRAWITGKYALPKATIVMAVAGVIYFVEPFDLIPDRIPVLGFVDDGRVITSVVAANIREILRFRDWEAARNQSKGLPAHPS